MIKYCGVDDAYAVPTYDSNGQMTFDQADTYTWDTCRYLSAILPRLENLTQRGIKARPDDVPQR
jgi:hypothetical protein